MEGAFQIVKAIHMRSIAAEASESSWMVYDEDLVYRPRYLPTAGARSSGFRVVVLGASLIVGTKQGSLVGRVDTVVNQDHDLQRSEWINAGVPGYTNYQELVYLRKYCLALEPHLVGVVFSPHDVHRFLSDVKVVNGRILSGTSFWDPTPEAAGATKGWALRLARHSLVLRWLRSETALARRAVDMYESSGYDFDYRPDYSTAWQDSQWTTIKDQMTEMAELSKAHHFRLFLVYVPFGEQYRKDYLARDSNYVLKPQRLLGALMADLKVPYLDLYPNLDNNCFQSDHIHFTEEGKERAAQKIAEFLKTEQLLPVK